MNEETNRYLYQMEPAFDDQDVTAVADCVRDGWVMEGARTAAFEQAVANFVGASYAVAVPSCTTALALSLMALGIGPGDEVLVPDLTFVASANAVNLAGAKPVLVDIHPENLGLDPAAAAQAITSRTKAIMPVWFNGRPPDMEALLTIANQYRLAVVEDAACALGSRWGGCHAGRFGHIGCFSFNTTKIITTSTGGMIVTDDPALYERVKRLKNHGRLDRRDYHPMVGFNFYFSDILAALGLAQMSQLSSRIAHKRQLYYCYYEQLRETPGLSMLPLAAETCPWYVDVFVQDAGALQTYLGEQQIQTRRFFPPVHTQPCYERQGDFWQSTAVSPCGLWLPSAFYLGEVEVRRVCRAIASWGEQLTDFSPAS